MKQRNRLFFLFLLLGLHTVAYCNSNVTVVDQSDSSLTIHFSLPPFTFVKREINSRFYTSIIIKSCQYIDLKASPELPRFSASLIIPKQANLSFEIIDSTYRDYNNITIIPSTGPLKRPAIESDFVEGSQYLKDVFYPQNRYSTGKTFTLRDINGTSIFINPFTYNPISKALRAYTELTIKISFRGTSNSKTNIDNSTEFNSIIENQFINYQKSRLKTSSLEYTPSSMLVLCPKKYSNEMNAFIAWKNQKGISTEMIVCDSLKTPSDFKTYIKNYYEKNKNTYVLLIGDSIDIPQQQTFAIADNCYIPSDNAYGNIIGNDSYPEVIVGRMTAKSKNDIITQTQRVIRHEKQLFSDSTSSRYVMVASDEGPGYNNMYDYQHLHAVSDSLKKTDYSGGDELYDGTQLGADVLGNPTSTMFVTSINKGKGLCMYTGHSIGNMLSTTQFKSSDALKFTNTKVFPFGIIAGCRSGQLSNDTCIAEACLWANKDNTPTGFSSMLASTVDQWWNPPMAGQLQFAEALIHGNNYDTIPSFGMLALKSFVFINNTFQDQGFETTDSWSIFGDPTLQIFTKKVDSISISFNKNISIGQDTLTIFSSKENIWICLSQNNKIIGLYRPSNGKTFAKFNSIKDSGTFIITTYGFNCRPTIDSVHISSPINELLTINNFIASSSHSTILNGDTVSISLQIENIGLVDASSYTVAITSSDSTIVCIKSNASVPTVAPSTQIKMNNAFLVHVADNAIDQSKANIIITFTSKNGKKTSYNEQFTINAPLLKYYGLALKPTAFSDSNSIASPGEIINIGIIMKNEGHAKATLSEIELQSQNNFLYTNEIKTPRTINTGITDTIFQYTVLSSLVPNGTWIPVTVSYKNNKTLHSIDNKIKIGKINEDWENNSLSNFKWVHETTNQWFINNTEGFKSNHSLQSGSILDNQSTTISLSFTLPFADSISFMAKTSCETPLFVSDHFVYYDYLDFRIDGNSVTKQAGITSWRKNTIPVSSGFHTFSWTYLKDDATSEGQDAAWIDDISLPLYTGYNSQQLSFTSTPDTSILIKNNYKYSISTNRDPSSKIALVKNPTWLTLNDGSFLIGTPTKVGIDTVIISARLNNEYCNQVFYIHTKTDVTINDISSNVHVFPNPVKEFLYCIDCNNLQYKITNYVGQIVQEGIVHSNGINISNLPNNVYIITFLKEQISTNQLFIKTP